MNNYEILRFCWKHKIFETELKADSGESVEVFDPGLYNRHDGPDFFNAKIKTGGIMLVGNVHVVYFASEWRKQSYDINEKFRNVILVLCVHYDEPLYWMDGHLVPVVTVDVPEKVRRNYELLISKKGVVACNRCIRDYSPLMRHAWLAALQTEHLERKSDLVRSNYKLDKDWQRTYLRLLFDAFGFENNALIMTMVFQTIEEMFFDSTHIDDLFQVEAVILGQAGLLELDAIPEKYQEAALNEGYYTRLRNEWLYLSRKFSMRNAGKYGWKPM